VSGFTKVDHSILEEVACRKFNSTQLSILLITWRMTYGFNRDEHELALNYFVMQTGFSKRNIQNALSKLIDGAVLIATQQASYNQTRKLKFNKRIADWKFDRRLATNEVNNASSDEQNSTTTVEEFDNSPVEELFNSTVEESITHDRKTRDIFIDTEDQMEKPNPNLLFEKHFGKPSSIIDFNCWFDKNDKLQDPEEIICEAIKRASLHNPSFPERYIKRIIDKWIEAGLTNIADIRESKTKNKYVKSPRSSPLQRDMFDKNKYKDKTISESELKQMEEMEEDFPF